MCDITLRVIRRTALSLPLRCVESCSGSREGARRWPRTEGLQKASQANLVLISTLAPVTVAIPKVLPGTYQLRKPLYQNREVRPVIRISFSAHLHSPRVGDRNRDVFTQDDAAIICST